MPSEETITQLQKYAPKCNFCKRLATRVLGPLRGAEHFMICGPFTRMITVPPGGPLEKEEVIACQLEVIADEWLAELKGNPELAPFVVEPLDITHRAHLTSAYYCDEHTRPGYKDRTFDLPLAEVVRKLNDV